MLDRIVFVYFRDLINEKKRFGPKKRLGSKKCPLTLLTIWKISYINGSIRKSENDVAFIYIQYNVRKNFL